MALSYGYDGFTINGDIDMDNNKITNLPDPSSNTEPVTKKYADTHYSGGGGGDAGPAGPQGPEGPQGPKGNKGDTGLRGLKGDAGPEGDQGPQGPRGIRGPQGPQGDTGQQGPKGDKGDTGQRGPQGDTGPAGHEGPRGPQGPQGIRGPAGSDGGLPDTGFTMRGDINMNSNRIINLQDPTRSDEPVTKQYADTNYRGLTANGFTMKDNISMGGHKIVDLPDPTANDEPVTKGYADTHYSGGSGGGPKGDKGDKGDTGATGPKGDKGDRGARGPAGSSGTISGDVDMRGQKLTGLPTPTQVTDAATKKWVTDDFPTKTQVLNGFTLLGPLDMGGHKIYEVRTPTNDKDAANKKYVDDHSGTFKDGTTTTSGIDLRKVLNSTGFFNDVTFHSGSYCQDIDSASAPNSVVNKNTLENGGLVGVASLIPSFQNLFYNLSTQKFDSDISLLVMKGSVSNHTVEHKDSTLNNVLLRKVGNDTQLTINFKEDLEHGIYSYELDISSDHTSGFDIFMYGECGGTGFNSSTLYRYYSSAYLSGKDFIIYQSSKRSFPCVLLVESVSREIDEIKLSPSHLRERETMHYSPVNNEKKSRAPSREHATFGPPKTANVFLNSN